VEEVGERLLMLLLVFEDEPEEVAVRLERVGVAEVGAAEVFEGGLAHSPEEVFHLAARGQVLRLLARRLDGVEDALVALVERGESLRLLQQPVRLEDADVREVPDERAVAEAGALVQLRLVGEVEDAERPGARLLHHQRELSGLFVHQSSVRRRTRWFIIPAICGESERTRRCLIPRASRESACASTG
jgi:hypothetical protein